jgi:hypothetical protein
MLKTTRREALSILALSATGIASAKLLSGCSETLHCNDTSPLTSAELSLRQANQYVDQSPNAAKNCANCNFFAAPAAENTCGGCTVVKGPINPAGYCRLWVAKQR